MPAGIYRAWLMEADDGATPPAAVSRSCPGRRPSYMGDDRD
jgi:hypothetical protein